MGLERLRDVLALRALSDFTEPASDARADLTVLLPPHVETSQIVEEWEARDFLARSFGGDVRIGNVLTLVDAEIAADQLASGQPISACGWGASARDGRSVADIAVGQIESATHLLVSGDLASSDPLRRVLLALNPTASTLALDHASDTDIQAFVACSRRASGNGCRADSARVVPPWLELLQAEPEAPCGPDRFLYRRSQPFDPVRFGAWFADPPHEIVRGKGKIWLANSSDLSIGYSCAGSVHRLFPAARWWASCSGAAWPQNDADRRRLLDLWHPHFGDRRQELAFVGVDLDPASICASLDACLLSEEEALDAALPSRFEETPGRGVAPRGGLN